MIAQARATEPPSGMLSLSPMVLYQKLKESREAERLRLAEHPEDSTSGKSCKQLYRIGERLGTGAFSEVKAAVHKQSGKPFAIKIVNTFRLQEADKKALETEIDLLKELRDDHLVGLQDVFRGSDHVYIVTELLNGGTLYDRIRVKGRYNEDDGRHVCKTLLHAMAFIHQHQVAHRDLKPENLMLKSPNNHLDVKIIDFGFAKKCPSPTNCLKTFIGTPNYVAPCILAGCGYGTQADIWSLGVIVYILFGGYHPFQEAKRTELFRKIRNGEYQFHDDPWANISQEAKDMIDKLLTVDPAQRINASQALQLPFMRMEEDNNSTTTTEEPPILEEQEVNV